MFIAMGREENAAVGHLGQQCISGSNKESYVKIKIMSDLFFPAADIFCWGGVRSPLYTLRFDHMASFWHILEAFLLGGFCAKNSSNNTLITV